jgi:hypothetical protein
MCGIVGFSSPGLKAAEAIRVDHRKPLRATVMFELWRRRWLGKGTPS